MVAAAHQFIGNFRLGKSSFLVDSIGRSQLRPRRTPHSCDIMSEFVEKRNNILLIIDPQVDFHEGGSLAVSGMYVYIYFSIL